MFRRPGEMEPLFPSDPSGELRGLSLDLLRAAAALGAALHPSSRAAVADLLRPMNSYYSNLIEGHHTHPLDIERALRGEYAADPARRALQEESRAHVEVQRAVEDRLVGEPDLAIGSTDFLRWIHRTFYQRLPDDLRWLGNGSGARLPVIPGALRTSEVAVGDHVAPEAASLGAFLERFAAAYDPQRLDSLDGVVAAAASHHRLVWIHPFLDGNGRVARLFSDAWLRRVDVGARGLWTLSRGLARRRDGYLAALTWGDAPRQGDLDGRGNLSDRGLARFCRFFLDTALDQVRFMEGLLALDGLVERTQVYARFRAGRGDLKPEARHLLRDVLLRGEVPRGEAARITGLSERTARMVLAGLLREGLLVPTSPKGPVRWGAPLHAAPWLFPRLYPDAMEAEIAGR